MGWRRINRILHRDIGYLAFGLTVIFSVSGVAVNHIKDWNPNYQIIRETFHLPDEVLQNPDEIPGFLSREKAGGKTIESTFTPAPGQKQYFFDKQTFTVYLQDGRVESEQVRQRRIFYEMNYLHLNHAKKWWTWFSDLYAVALLFLAVSGIILLKGKTGLAGRGWWLTLIGIVLPVLFLIIYL